jgi:plasminogen activator inhibitor 1 RNA-binding protein
MANQLISHREHTKQTDQGWGAPTGDAEWGDEKAGQDIASQEIKEGGWDGDAQAPGFKDTAAPAEGAWDAGNNGAPGFTENSAAEGGAPAESAEPAEPEDHHKSYADYLAEQATKKMAALGVLEPRPANEGSKQDKKWKNAKELTKSGDEEAYFEGAGEKARRERDRQRNAKEKVDLDYSFKEPSRGSERGGRGRGRGDRGDRGGRGRGRGGGDFSDRGDREGAHRGRGEGFQRRGDRGERGEHRGRGRGRGRGEGGEAAPVVISDENAFPSLGAGKK